MFIPAAFAYTQLVNPEQSNVSGPVAPYTYGVPIKLYAQLTIAFPEADDAVPDVISPLFGDEIFCCAAALAAYSASSASIISSNLIVPQYIESDISCFTISLFI